MSQESQRNKVLEQLTFYRCQLTKELKEKSLDSLKTTQIIQQLLFICEERGYL
jgi:hypothetical protein